jgi:HD-GYP domain-containing protein (c-di-GMP phosphodiesterase class II)
MEKKLTKYIPLQISTIIPSKAINFDLFIFFKEQYLLYIDSGKAIDDEKLDKLKLQKVARFYIRSQDEFNYQKYLDSILNAALENPTADIDSKVGLVEGAVGTGVEAMCEDPSTAASYKITQKAAKSLRKIIENNPNALKKIYTNVGETLSDLIKHSLNVCALSTGLGKRLGFSEDMLDDLGTAALLHDIGISKMKKEDRTLFIKPKKALTAGEKGVYKFHPEDSVKMLSDKPYVNPRVIELVRAHEENNSGDGPLKKKKLDQMEAILSLCNNYDKRVSEPKSSPRTAIKDLQVEEVGNYDLELIKSFIEMLKAEGLFDKK